MKRSLAIFAVLFVLLTGGLITGPSFVDWNKYKPQILKQLGDATGHEYSIGGSLDLAVLPYPHVSIGKLAVSTPIKGRDSYELVSLDKASVQLALLPLFKGEIVVSKVLLDKPVFKLAIGANGAKSWMTPVLEQKASEKKGDGGGLSGLGNAVALNEIVIKNGSFDFADYGSGKKLEISSIDLSLQGDSLYGPYDLDGSFVYNKQKVKLSANSGRLDNLAESIAVQLDVELPDVASTLSYAGVVSLKDKMDLQGETAVQTPDLGAMLAIVAESTPAYLQKKPFSSKGLLSFSGNQFAYKNLKLGFAGLNASGSVVVRDFSKESKGPVNVDVSLESSGGFDLESLFPDAANGQKKSAGLLPDSVTLPKDVKGLLSLKSSSVRFKGTNFSAVSASFERKEKGFGGSVTFKAPGNAAFEASTNLGFASQSKSSKNGSVTFSDPTLSMEVKAIVSNPAILAQGFVKQPFAKNVANILSQKMTSEAKVNIRPKRLSIADSFVQMAETRVNLSGSYVPNAASGRGALQIALGNFGFDVDKWMDIASPAQAGAQGVAAQKPDIAAMAKTISLPFDLAFDADMQSLRFKGRDYSGLKAKGRFAGAQLAFDSLSLTSNAGDVFSLAGSIKDVKNLQGIDISAQANLIDTEQTLQSFGVDTERLPPRIGKSDMLAELKGTPGKLAFTVNLKALRGSLDAAGDIADALGNMALSDLTLRFKHPNYVELARIYNKDFNSGVAIKKNLDIFASMSRKDNVYSFSGLQATIGPAVIAGDIVADMSGGKPAITAALKITDLPVDDLLGIRAGQKGSVRSEPLRKTQDVRWSREPIDTSVFHIADIDLKATANSISYGNWYFKNAGINVALKDGALDIKQLDGGLYGGHVALTGGLKTVAQPRQPLSFAGHVLVQDVALEEFVKSFSGSQLVRAKGGVSLEANLKTSGASQAALVFDLSGKGTANGKDIVLEGFDLARLSRALAEPSSSFTENFGRLLDASMGGGSTSFDTLEGVYTITEGVIKFDKLDLDGPSAAVVTRGDVSLPLWSLDLESTVQLKEPEDAPPLRASFKGPIDKPAQTFGQNAMQQYFQKQIQGTVLSPLLDKVDESGTLKQLLGVEGSAKQQPAPAPVPSGSGETQQQVAPQQQKKPMTTEDAIFGVIDGLLGGQ